ncbi:MAG: monovalent cation/H(+) antiporter subunit G [Acidimicrobiia bacterium]|nr:monovalent cation/H(+) antiporter subunit G [Acidimicrobiia bacterium]
MDLLDVASAVLILSGVALALLAGVGLQKFPDVFARMHAATKPATLGLLLILIGTSLQVSDRRDIAKLSIVILLQFITAPVGAHMVGRAAYRDGTVMSPDTAIDELATARRRHGETAGTPHEAGTADGAVPPDGAAP